MTRVPSKGRWLSQPDNPAPLDTPGKWAVHSLRLATVISRTSTGSRHGHGDDAGSRTRAGRFIPQRQPTLKATPFHLPRLQSSTIQWLPRPAAEYRNAVIGAHFAEIPVDQISLTSPAATGLRRRGTR
jgi:hypothetical protein